MTQTYGKGGSYEAMLPNEMTNEQMSQYVSSQSELGDLDLNELPEELDDRQLKSLIKYHDTVGTFLGEGENAHEHETKGVSSPSGAIASSIGKLRAPADTPIKGRITQKFDTPVNYTKSGRHGGLDIAAPEGTPIPINVSGTVLQVGNQGGKDYGQFVVIMGDDGVTRRYGHLSAQNVKQGQKVKPGDILGAVGNTGRSTGAHLHYEEATQ